MVEVVHLYSKHSRATKSLRSLGRKARSESADDRPVADRVPAKHSHRLNDADRAQLVADYAAGRTREELVKQYGVGKDTVTQAVVQSGQRMRRARVNENQREQIRRLHDEGQTPKAIAVTTGLNLSSVRRVLHSS